MDPNSLANSTTNKPRKVRFAPKAPPKREQKPVLPKVEKTDKDIDDAKAEQLLRRYHENSLMGKPKAERKVQAGPTRVAFGYGGSSTSLRSFGAPKGINKNLGSSSDDADGPKLEKEYKEPWNYYSYYPVTLPLRRPYSGNPELLDEEEFEEDPERSTAYDENETNAAAELGLLDENPDTNMLFFQFPTSLPLIKHPANAHVTNGDKGVAGNSQKPSKLEAIPAGLMGKMLVYKSGAVKLKLGDTLYNVSPGLNCVFAQDAVAINTEERHCCNMGELTKRAVVTPDIDSMLDAAISDL